MGQGSVPRAGGIEMENLKWKDVSALSVLEDPRDPRFREAGLVSSGQTHGTENFCGCQPHVKRLSLKSCLALLKDRPVWLWPYLLLDLSTLLPS